MNAAALTPLLVTVAAGDEQMFPLNGRFLAVKEATEGRFFLALDDGKFVPWDAGMAITLSDADQPFQSVRIRNASSDPITFEIIAANGRVYDQRLTVITNRIGTTISQDGVDASGVTPPTGGNGIRGWLSGIYAQLKEEGPVAVLLSGIDVVANSILTYVGAIDAKLPASLGQKAKSGSLSVTLASSHDDVPVTGPLTDEELRATPLPLPTGAATEAKQDALAARLPLSIGAKLASESLSTVPATDAVFRLVDSPDSEADTLTDADEAIAVEMDGRNVAAVQVGGTHSGAEIAFEFSLDEGATWFPCFGARLGALGDPVAGVTLSEDEAAAFSFTGNATHFRVRLVSITSGVLAVSIRRSVLPSIPPAIAPTKPITAGAIAAETAAAGAEWAPYPSQACSSLEIFNTSAVAIEYRRNGAGVAIPIGAGASREIRGIADADEIEIRRVDLDNAQVTIPAEFYS